MAITKSYRRSRIKKRIRKIVSGTAAKPRLSVFRSNKEIYAQLVDDLSGETILSVSSLKAKEAHEGNKTDQAKFVGNKVAELAKGKGIEDVVFDRNGYLYHGRVKSLAEAAREGGLKF